MMEEREYVFVKSRIRKLLGIDLACYKSKQMQRRLRTYLLRSGKDNWPAYFRAAQNDDKELGKLRDYLTINVSSFLRDADKYQYLQDEILPALIRQRKTLDIWSAGCSRGHEPYSLAMILAEINGRFRPHRILATDIDHSALAIAKQGGPYPEAEIGSVPPDLLQRYFKQDGDKYHFVSPVKQRVRFREHNLLADPVIMPTSDMGGYDLIVCRNVVIYFTKEIKEQLYHRFYQALRPGGVLFIGGTEIIAKAGEMGFETVHMSFYRRNGAVQRPKPPRFG
jgi:chemotaxis protein methyltransferase CheR